MIIGKRAACCCRTDTRLTRGAGANVSSAATRVRERRDDSRQHQQSRSTRATTARHASADRDATSSTRPSGYRPDAISATFIVGAACAVDLRDRTARDGSNRDTTTRTQSHSVTGTPDLRVMRHQPHDDDFAKKRHHFRHHTQKAGACAPALTCDFRWWRGQDLNLRPSGYEPAQCRTFSSRLLPCSTGDEAFRASVVTSTPVLPHPVRRRTAPFTAPRAVQSDAPRCVNRASRNAWSHHPSSHPVSQYGLGAALGIFAHPRDIWSRSGKGRTENRGDQSDKRARLRPW